MSPIVKILKQLLKQYQKESAQKMKLITLLLTSAASMLVVGCGLIPTNQPRVMTTDTFCLEYEKFNLGNAADYLPQEDIDHHAHNQRIYSKCRD